MAALRKKERSPYWFACFTLPDGRRVQRSTKETARKAAQAKADQWEKLAKDRAKARQSHRVIADIYQAAHSEDLPDATIRAFMEGWLKRREKELSRKSCEAYAYSAKKFAEFLGTEADRPIADLDTRQFIAFRDKQAERVSHSTVNNYTKNLGIIFEDARRDGFIADNPARDCPRLKTAKKSAEETRRPFTVAELTKLISLANEEMKSLILFGLYTGQRLGDLATLTWANLDLVAGEVQITTTKTGRRVRIPICAPLMEHIESLPVSDNPHAAIHPSAFNCTTAAISNRFGDLLASAGMAPPRSRGVSTGQGRDGMRTTNELSFHCLRHTATSLMKNAGVSPAIVQDIIGHSSEAVSANYTHIEADSKRKALDSLPAIEGLSVGTQ